MAILSDSFKTEFAQALLEGKKLPAKEALDICLEIIDRYKLWYSYEGPCDAFLCHPENRSRLMLSAHNADRLMEKIHQAGADLALLVNAIAIEIAKDSTKRAYQLDKNDELIKRAGGLLANRNGAERFLTIGCGHTAAGCKNAMAGGKTCSKLLQDVNGYMDVGKLKRNSKFQHMLEKGWLWKIIRCEVDEVFPDFAKIAQRALNSSNDNKQLLSETEIICQLADYHAQAVAERIMDPKATALEALQEQSRVAQYAYTLFEYSIKYGGGEDVPWIRWLDSIAKGYGTTKEFGHTFWDKMLTMKFYQNSKGPVEQFPLLRLALLILQAVSDKTKDGVATFLTQSDLKKAVSKAKATQALELEKMLVDGMQFTSLIDQNFLTTYQKELGQLFVRAALMLTDKAMQGEDLKKCSTADLKAKYLAELSKATGQTVTFGPWGDASSEAPAHDAAPAAAPVAATAFKDLSTYVDIEGQAKESGYKIGDIVVEKGNEDAPNMWAIVDMHDRESIIMHKVFDYNEDTSSDRPEKIKVSLQILMTRWRVCKDPKIPKTVGTQQFRPASMDVDVARADVFKALLSADKAAIKKKDQGIAFWVDPASVRTTRLIAAGELTLLPLVPMSMITTSNKTSSSAIQVSTDPALFIQPLPKLIQLKKGETELKDDQLAVAYWTVLASHSSNADHANMQEVIISKSGYDFKALQNASEIQPYTQLQVYKAAETKQVPTKLHGASVYSEEDANSKRRRITGKPA